ncbi:Uncharacterized protein APZ42_012445 [Daphnia magna]|uniref:Uncharacterized protein n=1 Tax=Daphnia magna TaxID=35525 RepID=A0A162RT86_9CRUS|nr:Uncharacterized protein APZ42_012445 [Daphnia magna]
MGRNTNRSLGEGLTSRTIHDVDVQVLCDPPFPSLRFSCVTIKNIVPRCTRYIVIVL